MSRAQLVVLLLVGVFAAACSSEAKHLAKGQTLTYQYTAFNQVDRAMGILLGAGVRAFTNIGAAFIQASPIRTRKGG